MEISREKSREKTRKKSRLKSTPSTVEHVDTDLQSIPQVPAEFSFITATNDESDSQSSSANNSCSSNLRSTSYLKAEDSAKPLSSETIHIPSFNSAPCHNLSQKSEVEEHVIITQGIKPVEAENAQNDIIQAELETIVEKKEFIPPTAPELSPHIPSTSAAVPQLVMLMQGLEFLKQRRSMQNMQETNSLHSHNTASTVLSAQNEAFSEMKTQIKSHSRIDCWSSLERARFMFGSEHLEVAQRYNEMFSENTVCLNNHQELEFAKLLEEYRDSMKMIYRKRSEMLVSESECEALRNTLWCIEPRNVITYGRCSDKRSVMLRANFDVAVWKKDQFPRVRRRWDEALADVASDFCVHQHSSLVTKYQLEECLQCELTTPVRLCSALSVLFASLNTSDSIPELHTSLTRWTYFTAYRLFQVSPHFESLMLFVNHLVRQSRSIYWALPLVQMEINCMEDVQKLIAALATILNSSRLPTDDVSQGKEVTESVNVDTEWTVVEQQGADLCERTAGCTLSERDLLALLHQLPIEDALRSLVRLECRGLTIMRDASGGNAVLKSACGAWELLEALRRGVKLHAEYRAVCDWLCRLVRLTLHCMADLFAATWSDCTTELRTTISRGLELLFHVGWRTLEECPHKEMSVAYQANLPFQVLNDKVLMDLYAELVSTITLEDSVECYHRLCCLANMADSRIFSTFTAEVASYLFQVGFSGASSESQRSEWARMLLGKLMQRYSQLYAHVLTDIAKLSLVNDHHNPKVDWLTHLEVWKCRPSAEQLRAALDEWRDVEVLLPHLIRSEQREVHHELATRIVAQARALAASKTAAPEWMYQALIDLKLHAVDWQDDLNSRPSPSESSLSDVTEHESNPIVCMWAVLVTSWGHSLPLICEYGAELARRVAGAGRAREAAHCLDRLLCVLVQSPESIQHTAGFKGLLTAMVAAGPSLASRLFGRRSATGVELLEQLLRMHLLETYKTLKHASPRSLLLCWLNFLTCIEDWSTTPSIDGLIETALECCSLHPDAVQAAVDHFKESLQGQTSKGKPGLQGARGRLAQLSAEHHEERASGLWHRLLWSLSSAGTSVDAALQKCGSGTKTDDLVIYRSAAAVLSCPVSHPVHLQLWNFFLSLYLDRPIDAQLKEFPPVGALFFQGFFKSRQLAQLVRRLQDTLKHHQDSLRESRQSLENARACKPSPNSCTEALELEASKQHALTLVQYHELVLRRIPEYIAVLEGKKDIVNSYILATIPIPECIATADLKLSPSECLRSPQRAESPPRAPPLTAPWHHTCADSYQHLEPAERITRRLQDLPRPLALQPPDLARSPLLTADSQRPRQLLDNIEDCLRKLTKHTRDWSMEHASIKSVDCRAWDLVPQLYQPRLFHYSETRTCGSQCTGGATLTVQGEEWCKSVGVERELCEVARGRRAKVDTFAAPRHTQGSLCAALSVLVRKCEFAGVAPAAFDCLVRYAAAVQDCPAIRDSVHALTARIGDQYVSSDAERCRRLLATGEGGALAPRVLRPAHLPPRELPRLYSDILRQYKAFNTSHTPPHLIFSYLSKFDIKKWCCENEELVEERRQLLDNLVDALGKFSPEPADDEMVLVELLCGHMSHLAAGQEIRCTELVTRASTAAMLPVVVWRHLEGAVRARARHCHITEITRVQEQCAGLWWETRRRAAPTSSLGPRALYALPAARVSSAYVAAALQTDAAAAMDPAQRGVTVLQLLLVWWDAWLQPWWGVADGAPPVAPWGANDEQVAAAMLDQFGDDLIKVFDVCEGGEGALLRHALWWCGAHSGARRGERDAQRARAVARQLARLPWSLAWFHLSCLPTITQMCTSEEGRQFCLGVLRHNRQWLPSDLHPHQVSASLAHLLHLFTDLPFDSETIEHAVSNLPWAQLTLEDFEPVLEIYFQRTASGQSAHSRTDFILILTAASFHKCVIRDDSDTANAKRLTMTARWTRATAERFTASGAEEEAREAARYLLSVVSDMCTHLGDDENNNNMEICKLILSHAATMLCAEPLNKVILPVWREWIQRATAPAVLAALGIFNRITAKECLYVISNEIVKRHLDLKGCWQTILDKWPASGTADLTNEMRVSCLYAAHATVLHLRAAEQRQQRPATCVRALLAQLASTKLNVREDEIAILMILCYITRELPIDTGSERHQTIQRCPSDSGEKVKVQDEERERRATELWAMAASILQPWTESSRFVLLKKITLLASEEPSDRFRLVCKLCLCVAIAALETWSSANTADVARYNAIVSEFSDLARTKKTDLGLAAASCRAWLSDKPQLLSARRCIAELVQTLYPDHHVHFSLPSDTEST